MAIELTGNAVNAIKRFRENESGPVAGLRLQVADGGCAGMTYLVNFDSEIKAQDHVFEKDGVKILCDSASYMFLNGTEVDYSEELTGAGFVFKNPNAASSCSCGTSFSA